MWTRAGDHYMVDRGRYVEEESLEGSRIVGVEGRRAECANLACRDLQSRGVSRGEDNVGSLRARTSRRFEPDTGAAADHQEGLPDEFRRASGVRSQGCSVRGSSE